MRRLATPWWRRPAAIWQFWRPQAGFWGGLLTGALLFDLYLAFHRIMEWLHATWP